MKDMASEIDSVAAGSPEALAKLKKLAGNPNIAEGMDEIELARIGDLVCREYRIDKDSMSDWTKRMELGLKLASLEKEEKTYPWKDAHNVKYPLVTTAVLMFNAKAYPAVVASDSVVKASVHGADPDGAKAARGERVSAHMSWQLTSKVVEWEEETDKLLTMLPLVGTLFRKTWFDPAWKRIRCRNILPGKLVINNRVTSLQDAPRCTEELSKYPAEIQSKRKTGEWRDIPYEENVGEDSAPAEDFLEQHRRIDLDKDGYDEPYIVTVHEKTQKVARIVADFTDADVTLDDAGKVINIQRGEYFTAYHFLPSMDGSFFSTGFGLLLGDISETINRLINLLMDAGHMASLGGGFIGSDFRMKGGAQRHKPGEWKLASATGTAIKDAIVPLTFPGPDKTLFELLGLLIEAGKEVASVKDVLQGETGGKTMTATTTLALIEQGMAQFTAAYKRIFRSLKQEYALIAKINRETVTPEEYNRFHDEMEPVAMPQPPQEGAMPPEMMGQQPAPGGAATPGPGPGAQPPLGAEQPPMDPGMMGHNGGPPMQPKMYDPREEYDLTDMDITPVADPASVTRMQEAAKAQLLMEMATQGLADPVEASKRMLEAAAIGDVEELAPKPNPTQEALAQAEIAEKTAKAQEGGLKAQEIQSNALVAQQQAQQASQQAQMDMAKFQAEMEFKHAEMVDKRRETDAKIDLIMAQIQKIMAEIQQGQMALRLQADQTELERGKAEAEIAFKGEEIGLAKRGADRDDFKAQKEVEHKGAEIGLNARQIEAGIGHKDRELAVGEKKTDAEIAHKDKEIGLKGREIDAAEPERKAKVGLTKAQTGATLNPDRPRADPEKPRKTRTRVTKHDDKGRILEFEQEED